MDMVHTLLKEQPDTFAHPTFFELLFLMGIYIFDKANMEYVVLETGLGGRFDTTNVIDTYVYRALLQSGNIGMASAAGFYQSIVGFACVLLANVGVRKLSPENAMF